MKKRARLGTRSAIALLILGTGCAPIWSPIVEKTPRPFSMPTVEMTMELPVGWMSSYYAPVGGYFFFTRHGKELEEISIRRFLKTLIVKGTNRSIGNEMTVQDIAELSIDSRRLDDGVGAFKVVSNRPATIGDRACFRLDYRYRNEVGLPKRTVEYGCPVGRWLYRFEYNAPTQYYFDRNLDDFEKMVMTIRFTTKGA